MNTMRTFYTKPDEIGSGKIDINFNIKIWQIFKRKIIDISEFMMNIAYNSSL